MGVVLMGKLSQHPPAPDQSTRMGFATQRYDEPEFTDLRLSLLEAFPTASKLVGHIHDQGARDGAIRRLTRAETRIICTFVGGRVAGIVFNPFHSPSVSEVKRIKSQGLSARKDKFALVCHSTTVDQLVDQDAVEKFNYGSVAGECFLLLPAKPKVKHLLPEDFWSDQARIPYVMYFIPKPDSHFEDLVVRATKSNKHVKALAGTSANLTNQGSITNRLEAAYFALSNNLPWLDEIGTPNPQDRGSFTILKIAGPNITEIRQGNVPARTLIHRLETTLR